MRNKLWRFTLISTLLLFCFGSTCIAGIFPTAELKDVKAALRDTTWVLVDTRLNDAYNGWQLEGVSRGGHIPGAVDFSANWLKVDNKKLPEMLAEALAAKGITKEKHIVLYDANGSDAEKVAQYLDGLGFSNLYLFDVKEWIKEESLPLEKYPNYQLIVPAVVVKSVIEGNLPESFEKDKNIKVVEASWGEEKTSYAKGHIPGTFHINTDRIEPPTETDPVMWMLADNETLKKFALDFGFDKNDTVIVTSEEPLASYRVASVLRYIGVSDVRVLNGGTLAWTMAGYTLETERHEPVAATDFGGQIPGMPDTIDTQEELKIALQKPQDFTLVDNRTWQEHIGETTGYSYHKMKGRIPGSVFGYAGKDDAYSLDYFRNPDKTMRNANEFLALWREQGIDTSKHLSFMCGSGWRAAEIYYYANVAGLENTSIYSDGWIGWSNNPDNPVVTGKPGK